MILSRLLSCLFTLYFLVQKTYAATRTCTVTRPLGEGKDDTIQILEAITKCGHNGHIIVSPGTYNITRKMTWNLKSSTVDLHGVLSFQPDVEFWLLPTNTDRVIFIQSQASWFVLTGSDFVVDAHGTGGIEGNGQPWWEFFTSHARFDGNGRPVSLTLSHVNRAEIRNFKINAPPFWCNAIADSNDVVYDGMLCNATNVNPAFAGQNIVPNTDGINTYRSDNISLLNFDITCGDDCLAIKGNSTNILASSIVCRGGNGIAFGSLGQYVQFNDIVENVLIENVITQRLDAAIQPNMGSGVYFKTWTGTVNGLPPTGGGGGGGRVNNVTARNVLLDRVSSPVHLAQVNSGHTGDLPSKLQFSDLNFANFTGTSLSGRLVDIECSPAVPCPGIHFTNFNVTPPANQTATFVCKNVASIDGLPGTCA